MGQYCTIVADPPWPYNRDGRTGVHFGEGDARPERARINAGRSQVGTTVAYPMMVLSDIAELPVATFAAADAHLYCWTTQRYLEQTFGIVRGWGFDPSCVLTWCKPIRGWTVGGTFMSTTEFVVFARRGTPAALSRCERQWFQWPRGEHSAKPDAFLDLVEQVSPGPYLELFARRQRLGWDTWGDEALEHVTLEAGGGGV